MSPQPARTLHLRTPLVRSDALSAIAGANVWLKLDCHQPVGSFKLRGMGQSCSAAVATGATRLVCSSGGNAGYAVAYAGRRLRVAVTVIVPETTSEFMRSKIRETGAEVAEHGKSWDDAHAWATTLARDPGTTYIHPFDDPVAWEGHATVIDEAVQQAPRPDVVVVAVGGGGLLCGMLLGMQRHGWDDVRVVAVETIGADSFKQSADAGRLVTLDAIRSLATTLGARTVTGELMRWKERRPIEHWLATDAEAVDACYRFLDDHRVLVEPACGAALASVYAGAKPLRGSENILIEVCGGAGVSLELLAGWRASASP